MSSSEDADLEVNETTKLISDDDLSGALSSPISQDGEIWQEMNQPWPATFERSISLLSSPVIQPSEIDRLTKSPKPGNTPLAARMRMVREKTHSGQFDVASLIFNRISLKPHFEITEFRDTARIRIPPTHTA